AVTPAGVEMMTDITHYLDFVMMVFFAFGLCFEIPVVQVIVAATGLVSLQKLKSWRRYAIVAAAAVAAAITPPDITSMLLLLVPMVVLYELGIIAVRLLVRPKPAAGTAEESL
ncbi:MAG: twin-arginine translocase subunit TatC, partial [Xanthomonadaceae bacterium]|nr:twin-arginine translocase subunit TatC [Xanthomonadaceae bacterium]